jgi:hypothetical protein
MGRASIRLIAHHTLSPNSVTPLRNPKSHLTALTFDTRAQKKFTNTYRFFLTVNFHESIPSLAATHHVAGSMSNHRENRQMAVKKAAKKAAAKKAPAKKAKK